MYSIYIYQLPNIQSYSKAFKDPFSKSKDDALKYFFFQSEMLLIKCVCVCMCMGMKAL